jgi:hypothetical protein
MGQIMRRFCLTTRIQAGSTFRKGQVSPDQREAEDRRTVKTLRANELVAPLATKRYGARAAHVVLALHEMDFVLVAAQQGKKRRLEILGGLALAIIVDDERRLAARTVGQDLESLSLDSSRFRNVPILVIGKEAPDRVVDRARRLLRLGLDPLLKAPADENRIDAIRDFLDERGDRRGLLILHDPEVALILPVRTPVPRRIDEAIAGKHLFDFGLYRRLVDIPEEFFDVYW